MLEYRLNCVSNSLDALSILLDTQDGKHEYVRVLQEEYSNTTQTNPENTCGT